MDPELQRKIDEARANGYEEPEIQAYLQSLQTPTPAQAAAAASAPVPTEEAKDRTAEYTGLLQGAGLEAAKTALELYGAKKFILDPLVEKFGSKPPPAPPPAPGPGMANASQAVVNGPARTVSTPTGRPMTVQPGGAAPGPVAPTPTSAGFGPAGEPNPFQPPRQPGLVQQGMDMARKIQQLAFEKVMQGGRAAGDVMANAGRAAGEGLVSAGQAAAPYARAAAAPVAVGLTAALMPGNAGGAQMMIPQKGPYRGMEINPMTNRPWTAQELAVINR